MAWKDTKLYAMLNYKCPQCHKGDLFLYPTYHKKLGQMPKRCPQCKQSFEPEPGFYFGAAYVSYALTIAFWVALYVAFVVFDSIGLMSFHIYDDMWFFMIIGVIGLLILLPPTYRLSRSMWINMFVEYKKGIEKEVEEVS